DGPAGAGDNSRDGSREIGAIVNDDADGGSVFNRTGNRGAGLVGAVDRGSDRGRGGGRRHCGHRGRPGAGSCIAGGIGGGGGVGDPTLAPYTTLFRSDGPAGAGDNSRDGSREIAAIVDDDRNGGAVFNRTGNRGAGLVGAVDRGSN